MDSQAIRGRSVPSGATGSLPGAAVAEFGDRVTRGVVAGVAAGLVFLIANMGWATSDDLPGVAPLLDISTIFNFDEEPSATPENMAIGLVTHLTLSVAFGLLFALLATQLAQGRQLALGGLGFGVLLYVVNFQILGRTVFPWFQEGPDQLFELVAHAGFGLLLVPFFVGERFGRTDRPEKSLRQGRPAP